MKDERKLNISLKEDQFPRVDKLILDFCKKYRIYDEYYGVISRAVDIVIQKISHINPEHQYDLEIKYQYNGKEVRFEIQGNSTLNAMFDYNISDKEMETLKLLVTEIEFPDTNQITLSFNLNALHQQEWVRRNTLINSYYNKTKKHV